MLHLKGGLLLDEEFETLSEQKKVVTVHLEHKIRLQNLKQPLAGLHEVKKAKIKG